MQHTLTAMHRFQMLIVGAHPRKWPLNNKTVRAASEQQTRISDQWTPVPFHSGAKVRHVASRSRSVK